MIYAYTTFLYNPLLNTLIFFYNTIALRDFGLAIIVFTIFIRILLFPLFQKSARHQVVMQRLQPHLKKIEEKHKGDRDKQGQEMMALYKEHNFNPFFGFLFILIQLPILIALYRIFLNSLQPDFLTGLYGFIYHPTTINISFLNLINLGQRSIIMVALAAAAQYYQGVLTLPTFEENHEWTSTEKVSRQMVFLGPVMTLIIFYNMPAAVSLYWLVATLFSIFQQIIINKKTNHGELGIIRKKNN